MLQDLISRHFEQLKNKVAPVIMSVAGFYTKEQNKLTDIKS